MKKIIVIIVLIICIFVTVSCKTVKESEKEKKDEIMFEHGNVKMFANVDILGDTTWRYTADPTASSTEVLTAIMNQLSGTNYTEDEFEAEMRQINNEFCKKMISVYPNPTPNATTINIYYPISSGVTFGIKYKLIFDERIIYENDNNNISNVKKEVIPEHLLQNNGVYVIAYEIYGMIRCTGTVNFMVTGKK